MQRLRTIPLSSITGLDLSDWPERDRLTLMIWRAAQSLGFARALCAPADQLAHDWPAFDDVQEQIATTLYQFATGRALADDTPEGLSLWTAVCRHTWLGLRDGYDTGRKALEHGIPEGIEQRFAYRARLDAEQRS